MRLLESIPVAGGGIALALATMSRLLEPYGRGFSCACLYTASLLLTIVLLRYLRYPRLYKEDAGHPLSAPIMPVLPMTVMSLSTYTVSWSDFAGLLLWYGGLIWHGSLILSFTKRFIGKFRLENVLPSWFVIYVGIVVAVVGLDRICRYRSSYYPAPSCLAAKRKGTTDTGNFCGTVISLSLCFSSYDRIAGYAFFPASCRTGTGLLWNESRLYCPPLQKRKILSDICLFYISACHLRRSGS